LITRVFFVWYKHAFARRRIRRRNDDGEDNEEENAVLDD
jgi:hypothetical protein